MWVGYKKELNLFLRNPKRKTQQINKEVLAQFTAVIVTCVYYYYYYYYYFETLTVRVGTHQQQQPHENIHLTIIISYFTYIPHTYATPEGGGHCPSPLSFHSELFLVLFCCLGRHDNNISVPPRVAPPPKKKKHPRDAATAPPPLFFSGLLSLKKNFIIFSSFWFGLIFLFFSTIIIIIIIAASDELVVPWPRRSKDTHTHCPTQRRETGKEKKERALIRKENKLAKEEQQPIIL
eukprot:gene10970-7615_t